MIRAQMFLYNSPQFNFTISFHLLHVSSLSLVFSSLFGHIVFMIMNNTFIAFLLTLSSSTRDALRLAGDLHDRRRRPHVPSQGELLINCNISSFMISSSTTTTNITNVCPPDKMGDGWLRKCWCLDLLSLHHL